MLHQWSGSLVDIDYQFECNSLTMTLVDSKTNKKQSAQ